MKLSAKRRDMSRIALIISFCLIAVVLIAGASAAEPAWTYPINESPVSTLAVSSDGSTIIVAADRLWIFSGDGALLKKEQYGDNVVVTPSGRFAASSFGGTVYFFSTPLTAGSSDPNKMAKVWDYEFRDTVRSIDITDDGSLVAVKTQGMGMFLILTSTKEIFSSEEFYNAVLRISHDGSRIVGVTGDTVRLYYRNGKLSKKFTMKNITSSNPDFVLLSQTVPIMVFNDGTKIRSFDLSRGTDIWNARPGGALNSLAMTPSGSFVVAGTANGEILRFNDTGLLNWSFSKADSTSLSGEITKVVVSRDGGMVGASTEAGSVFLLNSKGFLLGSYQAPERIRDIAMSQDGSLLLVGSERNISAFFTGYTPYTRSTYSSVPRFNTSERVTYSQNLTRRPVVPVWTTESGPGIVTEIPTEYSVIRTPKKSDPGFWYAVFGILVTVFLYRAFRR